MTMTPQIAQIKEAVGRKFAAEIANGELTITGGVFNCRKMRGKKGLPNAWSEHSWGNAWDLYYRSNRAVVERVVAWLRVEDSAGRLPVGSIITYGANGTHVHIEGSPKRNPRPHTSVPPCAEHTDDPEEDEAMVRDMQKALNEAGIPDYQGKPLVLDGKWGPRTASAHATMVGLAAQMVPPGTSPSGEYQISGTVSLAPESP